MQPTVNKRGDAPLFFLVDNGSLRPEATFSLRTIARCLGERVGQPVHPVSLLHSHKIAPEQLGGVPAQILLPTLQAYLAAGAHAFVFIPLFFGPSRALTEYIPTQVKRLKNSFPELSVRIAQPLVDVDNDDDNALATILKAQIDAAETAHNLVAPKVILVDHGTPAKSVNAVRNFLGKQLAGMLEGRPFSVASMERREGPAYDFNEPLLANVLGRAPFDRGPIVLSMLFLNPGRHAGEGGDIDTICAQACGHVPNLHVYKTGLVGEHPGLVDILARKFTGKMTVIV